MTNDNFNKTTNMTGGTIAGAFTQGTCPHCGYCPHCGRGGYQTYPYYPWYPYQQPTIFLGQQGTSTSGNISVVQ